MVRVDGDIRRLELPVLEDRQVHELIHSGMNESQQRAYEETLEADFAFEIPGVARVRVNAFHQARGPGAVLLFIPGEVVSLEAMGLGDIFRRAGQEQHPADRPDGLRQEYDAGGHDRLYQ